MENDDDIQLKKDLFAEENSKLFERLMAKNMTSSEILVIALSNYLTCLFLCSKSDEKATHLILNLLESSSQVAKEIKKLEKGNP